MKYNTKTIKNIDDESFVGRFNGVDFGLDPGQTRYLPSFVSEHLANQLLEKINRKRKKKKMDLAKINEILGSEIETAEATPVVSFKEEVENYEREFEKWKEQKEKDKILKKEEALNISKNL